MARADRLEGALDHGPAFAAQMLAVERGLELFLEIVLAALDLVDDGLLVAAGERRLEVKEALVGLAMNEPSSSGLPPRRRTSARKSSTQLWRSVARSRNISRNRPASLFAAASS